MFEGTSKEKFFHHNTLLCLVNSLQGKNITLDVRNDAYVCGKVDTVDGYMNISFSNAVYSDSQGNEFAFENLYIQGRNIRYVHIPDSILTTLNFMATGSYQKPTGQDWLAPISQSSVSRCINEVVEALNQLLPTYIKFPITQEEKNIIKQGFYEKYHMPGVLGCVDGTLIAIAAPRCHPSEAAFFSRKGYHAINAAIICNSDMKIIGICAKFGGAAHDSYVWRSWSISRYLEEEHGNGMTGWLLGDSGYPQRPWLMTPVLHAAENTPEAHYTNIHVHTRVCIEQCIGLLKARWRCLLRHRVLHYEPTKCAKIINACAVLHNLCLNDSSSIINDQISTSDHLIVSMNDEDDGSSLSSADNNSRQQLINVLWQNRTAT